MVAFKKIVEEQSNVDSPIFTAKYNKERDITRISVEGWGMDNDRYTELYLEKEELEDFFFFMEQVYEQTR